jgi:head-tail adaptor
MKTSLTADWPSIDPGTFRHQIQLLAPTAASDAVGSITAFSVTSPPTFAWASIDYMRGADLIKQGVESTNAWIKVKAWYRPEFTTECRIQLPSGAQFAIQYVENVRELSAYMVLTCLGIGQVA